MTTAAKSTPAKATAPKAEVKPTETPEVVSNDTAVIVPNDVKTEETEKPNRIPEYLAENSILANFCERYLGVLDEIAEYNKAVLAEKSSEWNANKVLEKARSLGRPTDKNVKPNEGIKSALETWEKLINETAKARKAVLDATSKELGITLTSTAERNSETEAPLKEHRKMAMTIGSTLSQMAEMTTDVQATTAVNEFLALNPLPMVGRDQVSSFGSDGTTTTPKYRVKITVTKDGNELLNEDGFTKTKLKLTQPVFGYERGKAPTAETLREAWEKAGNTPEKTVTNPVEFDDNGLHFTITKK